MAGARHLSTPTSKWLHDPVEQELSILASPPFAVETTTQTTADYTPGTLPITHAANRAARTSSSPALSPHEVKPSHSRDSSTHDLASRGLIPVFGSSETFTLQNVDPFQTAFTVIAGELASTTMDIAEYIGQHAHVGALLHHKKYKRAPRLSQILADLVRQVRPFERMPPVATLASMWLFWCLCCCKLAPSAKNHNQLPQTMRPTKTQCATAHTIALDFVIVPDTRSSLCREAPWVVPATLAAISSAELSKGPRTALHALHTHALTRAIDLTDACKYVAMDPVKWSIETK